MKWKKDVKEEVIIKLKFGRRLGKEKCDEILRGS
jgi:hypothetical protein